MTAPFTNPHDTSASRLSVLDPEAKTPQALALAIARYSAVFRNDKPSPIPVEALMRLHRASLHETLLDHADLEADAIRGDGGKLLWVCPLILEGLRAIGAMDRAALELMAALSLARDPSLRAARFTALDGTATQDLAAVLHDWSRAALALFEEQTVQIERLTPMLMLFCTPGAFPGVADLASIDDRITDVAALMGVSHPAEIEEFLLRLTGLVDLETAELGPPDGVDIQGLVYALVLALVASRQGLKVGREVPRISLQQAYGFLLGRRMLGRADCLASGGTKSCELHQPGSPMFTVDRPEAIRAVAAALCGVIEERGEFAALVATSDLLCDGALYGQVDASLGRADGELGFVTDSHHGEAVVREILSDQLFDIMPPIYAGDDEDRIVSPHVAAKRCERLTELLRVVHPGARPIQLAARHKELVGRLADLSVR